MIIQRGTDGFGRADFCGEYSFKQDEFAVARVVREDDNMTVIGWQRCEKTETGWEIALVIPEGGLYRAEARVTAGEFNAHLNNYDWAQMIACARHFGVGDIFVMAGQSNMSGYGKDPAYDPPQLGVHLFDNAGMWGIASHPLATVSNPVYGNNDGASGTSPGLAFGRMMSLRLGVPVGLVSAALGGSPLEAWNPAEENCWLYKLMAEKVEEVGGFAGMVWYQGCNETGDEAEAKAYFDDFSRAVSLWREKFGFFEIVTCQLNRHAWKGEPNDRNWGIVREAQRRAAKELPGVFVVPTLDMYTSDGIHNASGACIVIGERMASAMLKGKYGLPGCFAPDIKRIKKLDEKTILLEFEQEHTLRTMDDLACGMNIEDENGMMKCTAVSVCESGAKVTGEREIGENAVFHAYWEREEPAFFLRDIYGMPMLACFGVKID